MPDGLPSIDPDVVASRIGGLLAERRPGAVKPLLAALARLAPDHEKLASLRAAYWWQMQDPAQALAVLQEAIDEHPDNAALWLQRAELFFDQHLYDDAAQNAAQAVLLAPASGTAKSRLGLALIQLGEFDQAVSCLTESYAANPANIEVALALAALLPNIAADILSRAISANPQQPVLRNALMRRFLCCGMVDQTAQAGREASSKGIADAQTYCLLAVAKIRQSNWEDALAVAARAQSIAPDNMWARRLWAALSDRQSGMLTLPVPDDADAAERALISGGTIAPGIFRELIEKAKTAGPVLDLFCGVGLNAIAAQGVETGKWTGVDPSSALIARCDERGIYAQLQQQADPLQALVHANARYSVILLNEALAYRESPQSILGAVRNCLAAGGVALAAIPTGRGLGGHGLFSHREADILKHAANNGLSFEVSRTGILRQLEGLPVHGMIASFRAT